jgi:L-asparaginase/Glu-tRNA(Gln) amidotransferase subunit D
MIGHEGLAAQGYIAAGALTPWKARLLLMFSMLHTTDPSVMQRHFEDY